MTQAQLANIRLIADSMQVSGMPSLGDDALIYQGSAQWDDWRNHVPKILAEKWAWLSEEARLCIYVTAHQVTTYNPLGHNE